MSPQFSSVAQSCPTLCNPMDCTMPGFPVHHQLPEPAQTHVHWVGDAIQPSCPQLSPSPAFNVSQHQGLFSWVNSSHLMAKVLELQHQWVLGNYFYINEYELPSSVVPFSWLQFLPASGSLQMSQFFASDGQNVGASALALHWSFQCIFRFDFLSDWLVWSPCCPIIEV